jgi:hypothetical protein
MFFQDIFYFSTETVCFDFKPFFNGHDVRLKDDLVEWLKLNHDCWRNKSLDPIIQIFRVPFYLGAFQ